MTMISVRTSSGAACCEIDRMQLDALIGDNSIIGVTRGKRLLYVQLIKPPSIAFRAMGEGRHGNPQKLTYEEHFSSGPPITVLKLHSAVPGTYKRDVRAPVAGGAGSNGAYRPWREDDRFAQRSARKAASPAKWPVRPQIARSE
jgi:hypothetical protein